MCVCISPNIFTEFFPDTHPHFVIYSTLLQLSPHCFLPEIDEIFGPNTSLVRLLSDDGKTQFLYFSGPSLWREMQETPWKLYLTLIAFPCREIQMNQINFLFQSKSPIMLDEAYGWNYFAFWKSIHFPPKTKQKNNKFSHCQVILKSQNIIF